MSPKKETDLSRNSCVVLLGTIGSLVGILVSCIALFTFVTGRTSLVEFMQDAMQDRPTTAVLPTLTPESPTLAPLDFDPLPTLSSGDVVFPDTSDFSGFDVPLPEFYSCPQLPGMFWLEYPDVWYGPFLGGDALLLRSDGGFDVWDADLLNLSGAYGAILPYPDPYYQMPRNEWLPLNQSIFSVCVDSDGYAFGYANY